MSGAEDRALVEQELRIELMATQIEHYKSQIKWEPWKVIILAIGAGAAFATAFIAASTAVLHAIAH
jgi:hypothetical protein